MTNPIAIPTNLRKPLRIEGKSNILRLAKFRYWHSIDLIKKITADIVSFFPSGDFYGNYRDTVYLNSGNRELHVDLCSNNLQLIALDDSIDEFKFGYEPEIAALIDAFVPQDGVFCDAGANFGYFSIYLASTPGFAGKIHAFEPSQRGHRDLSALVYGFGLQSITPVKMALGKIKGQIDLVFSTSDGLSTTVPEMTGLVEQKLGSETVAITTLDSFDLPRLDFIKIDVEGAECDVVLGGAGTLGRHKPYIVFESWLMPENKEITNDVFLELSRLGYEFFAPCWKGHDTFYPQLTKDMDSKYLYLIKFDSQDRWDLPRRVNVFAVHRTRVDNLLRLFGNPGHAGVQNR